MPSERQSLPTEKNAAKSTGRAPTRPGGIASQCATPWFAIAIETDPAFEDEIEKLAKALSLSGGRQKVDENAREAARAEFDLLRIRKIRTWLFETLYYDATTAEDMAELNDKLAKLERYERRAFSRRNRALREL